MLELGLLTNAESYSDEIEEYLKSKEKRNLEKLNLCFTITTKCDLGCDYCFQNHLSREDSSREIIDEFVSLIEGELIVNSNIKEINLLLFGGEPLKRLDLCLYLLEKMQKLCRSKHIKHHFSISTNGLFEKPQGLDMLKSAGLKSVQITFDGSRYLHNESRGKKLKRKDLYSHTISNLVNYTERFSVALKYNISKRNVTAFEEFLKDLRNAELLSKVVINLEALQEPLTNKDDSLFFEPSDANLAEVYLKLATLAQKSGTRFDIYTAFRPPCMVTSKNSFVVETNGSISSCLSAYEIPELELGSIQAFDPINLDRKLFTSAIMKASKKLCIRKKCSYFPICETGCFFIKSVAGMAFEQPYCRESFYSKIVLGLIHLCQGDEKCFRGF